MTNINKSILEALVATQKDEFSELMPNLGQNSDLAEAILEIQRDEKTAAVKAAAIEIQKLVKAANNVIDIGVDNIRRIRRQEIVEQAMLKNINIAQAYGYATMNFLPLLSVLNGDTHHTVPADWKAPGVSSQAAKPASTRATKK